MTLGPYYVEKKNKIAYRGNKIFKPIDNVKRILPRYLSNRHLDVKKSFEKWGALIRIWDGVFKATNTFMGIKNVYLFDLPITTRMISSPGALTGTISSDVDPFEIKFFKQKTFLTQSSQLYLEFAITNPQINSVYCWEKSFRREKADFRHLPEFTHVEFESNIKFEENLEFQKDYLQFLVGYLIKNYKNEIGVFLSEKDIKELAYFSQLKNFKTIKLHEAFSLLKKRTNDAKYNNVTVKNFGAYEEVLLSEIVKEPIFVTHYIEDEVAFYHAKDIECGLVVNADFIFPGYGELIGSGERVHTRKETLEKARYFKLDIRDYRPYVESRDLVNPKIHSGWGMGIERFVQAVLKLPFIWETKVFPRVHTNNRP